MNIGIATFSNAMSYGAVLQAFALKTVLEEMGHRVTVIDAECNGNVKFQNFDRFYAHACKTRKTLKRRARLFLYRFVQKKHLSQKINNFEKFRNEHLYASYNVSADCDGLDLIVCGSDQIWNPTITKNFFDLFFGINMSKVPAIAYAASVGDVGLIKGTAKEKEFFDKIANFKAISCRENDLNAYLNENGVQSKTVIDPSILLDAEKYISRLGVEKKTDGEKYVFVYHLNKPKVLKDIAKKVSRKLNCKKKILNGVETPVISNKNVFGDCKVEDFVRYVNNAECVVTDSFHGVAFSIIMKKNFYAVLPATRKQRIVSLLEKLGLMDRIVDNVDAVEFSDIDYDKVYIRLKELRNDSLEYLKEHMR